MERKILLTFDLEEFDLPLEFGCSISEEDQINVTNCGMQRLTELLSEYNITATFFTTALYANKNKKLIKDLSSYHEIASHSKTHSDYLLTDPSESKNEIEQITGKRINGFRMPRFRKTDLAIISAAGYKYDSSINPTFIPGRYNNFFTDRKYYLDQINNIVEFPVSVSPFIRFPLFWMSFKNIPLPAYYLMCKMALQKDSYLHLYFHPWEFADLKPFDIPWYIKNLSGEKYTGRFEKMIVKLQNSGEFSTISGYLESLGCI